MKLLGKQIRLAATDLSNHLACRHLTTLDLDVALGKRSAPELRAPDLKVIQELGLRFEKRYLAHLEALDVEGGARKLTVVNLRAIKDEARALQETLALMQQGVDVIAQGALGDDAWFGRPDVLRRVPQVHQFEQAADDVFARAARVESAASQKWPWSYEVLDTKLTRETKATTILQLSLYSELLKEAQGAAPEFLWVVTPAPSEQFTEEQHRVSDYAAYYAYVKKRLIRTIQRDAEPSQGRSSAATQFAFAFEEQAANESTYPEPVEHCQVCRWFPVCDARRREDDHLSLVAGIRRQQRDQFVEWNVDTMAKLAALPIPLRNRPKHGSEDGYERVQRQAKIQVEARERNTLKHELLEIAEGMGLCRLPEPSPGDMFVDLEGDPFVGEHGLRYLFGFAGRDAGGELQYERRWALDQRSEKESFEWLIDEISRRREAHPKMHVYHFSHYEPSAFKDLMGLHATREDAIDRMLRAGVFVDLHLAFKQGVRASVEEYSLKKIEVFYGFRRTVPPEESRAAMRYVEHGLELNWMDEEIPEKFLSALEGYNAEDCFSAAELRDWLEAERDKLVGRGTAVPRFCDRDEKASEDVEKQQTRAEQLVRDLTKDLPKEKVERTREQQAQWLLAQLIDWHRRDAKPNAWRYFDLRGMDDADLLEEKDAVSGLTFIRAVISPDGSFADRYSFPSQETNVRPDEKKEVHHRLHRIGTIVGMDPVARTIDIKKANDASGFHPTSIFVKNVYRRAKAQQDSLYRLGCWVRDNAIDALGPWQGVRSFLLRRPPQLLDGENLKVSETEEFSDELFRVVSSLNSSVLAVQGPPGSGKTSSAALAIDALVTKHGMKIGVTALSHSVIRGLLKTMGIRGSGAVRCMHKADKKYDGASEKIEVTTANKTAEMAIKGGSTDVLGGTAFLWAREEFANSVDVLFVDEASQVSLADLLAISQAAENVVLIGDPQQLSRPGDACHPEGAELSSLAHILKDPGLGMLKTMPRDLGLFIEDTKRLHPNICDFTSTTFYEGRLVPHGLTRNRIFKTHPWITGAGLWFVPVGHEGNRNSSSKEVEVIERIVGSLLSPEVRWVRSIGRSEPLRPDDILIVAPYNAQVSDLTEALPGMKIGTVDKFQGQEAAVVIYSMTTSSPEEAPRGMEFLYSLHRLNVATSRAKTAVILVGSPKLFEPECRTPRQMQLANALCAYREMATEVDAGAI